MSADVINLDEYRAAKQAPYSDSALGVWLLLAALLFLIFGFLPRR